MAVTMPPKIDVYTEDELYTAARAFHALISASTYANTQATAIAKRMTNLLRNEGLDANNGGLRGRLIGSDAQRIAAKVVQPLFAISADLENVSRNGVLFERRALNLVFEPIREARRLASSATSGETIKVN